jgi:hypothetical protein
MLILLDIIAALIVISILIFTMHLMCLSITEDRDAGVYPDRLPDHERNNIDDLH